MTAHSTPQPSDGDEAMVTFYDAVADDPDMTAEQKIHWLRVTAADYFAQLNALQARLDAALRVVAAAGEVAPFGVTYRMLYRELQRVESERNHLQARLAAAERVIAATRTLGEIWYVNPASPGNAEAMFAALIEARDALAAYDAPTHPDTGGDDA